MKKTMLFIMGALMCCISLFAGVFAASNANHTISGNLWHDVATGVSAKVTTFEFTNTATNCTYYNSSVGHNSATTADLFTLTSGVTNVTITDSNNKLTITSSGSGTSQTITYTGTSNLTGTLTCTITATGQSATISYTTKYTLYNHKYIWGCDATNHWEECDYCGDSKNVEAHDDLYGTDNGDGTHSIECGTCGYVGDDQAHVESNGEYVSDGYDATYCWDNCDVCGTQMNKQTHYIEGYGYDSESCWQACAYCDVHKDENSHYRLARYDGGGQHEIYCDRCDYSMEYESCSYGDWYDLDGHDHTQQCQYCYDTTWMMDAHGSDGRYYDEYGDWTHGVYCSTCDYFFGDEDCTIEVTGNYNDSQHEIKCNYCGCTNWQAHYMVDAGGEDYALCIDRCGYILPYNPLSTLSASAPSTTTTPILSTYGVLNSTLSLAQSSGMLEAPDVTDKNSLLYNYKKQYSYKVKKLFDLLNK